MPFLGLIAAALIGWLWWTKRVTIRQLPGLVLAAVGGFIALKGQFLGGIGVAVIGLAWFAGTRTPRVISQQQTHQYAIDEARQLLGASIHDDADKIRLRHRKLISANHPDTGGSEERAAKLNEARDLLLAELKKQD